MRRKREHSEKVTEERQLWGQGAHCRTQSISPLAKPFGWDIGGAVWPLADTLPP